MIGYGCPRVLRYLSLMRETVILYNYKKILQDLDITSKDFTDLVILAGTDYGKFPKNIFLWYNDYILYQKSNIGISFLDYLQQKKILSGEDVERVVIIRDYFNPPYSIEQYPYQSFKTKCGGGGAFPFHSESHKTGTQHATQPHCIALRITALLIISK